MSQIRAAKPLRHAHLLRLGKAAESHPDAVVEPYRFDDQSVFFPASDRVAHERRVKNLGMRASVQVDLTGRISILVNQHQKLWGLHQPDWCEETRERQAHWQTVRHGRIGSHPLASCTSFSLGP